MTLNATEPTVFTEATIDKENQRTTKSNVRFRIISALAFVALIVLWQVGFQIFNVSPFFLPTPLAIWSRLVVGLTPGPSSYYNDAFVTLQELLLAFVIASVLGIIVGFLMARLPTFERVLFPYVFVFQVLPKVAIAPLFVIWLGYGISAMVAIAVVAAFFPMMVNALVAFKGVEVGRAVMFRALCASPWQTFWKLQVPSALPVLLSGLELSIVYSLTGTIVGEFVGGQAGLGARLLTYNATLDIAGGFAILVLLAVIGMVLQGGLNIVRRKLLFWTPSEIGRR